MKNTSMLSTLALITALQSAHGIEQSSASTHQEIAAQWEQISFKTESTARENQFASLSEKVAEVINSHDTADAELLTWAGIVNASYAGEKGGLGALKLVKTAKSHLERALAIDPNAGNGGAMTTLGTLYDQVPGWPIGFGNQKTAEKLLFQAAQEHPDNLVSQYFLGTFLMDHKRKLEAKTVFTHALKLQPRPHAMLSDSARLDEIKGLLLSIEKTI